MVEEYRDGTKKTLDSFEEFTELAEMYRDEYYDE